MGLTRFGTMVLLYFLPCPLLRCAGVNFYHWAFQAISMAKVLALWHKFKPQGPNPSLPSSHVTPAP